MRTEASVSPQYTEVVKGEIDGCGEMVEENRKALAAECGPQVYALPCSFFQGPDSEQEGYRSPRPIKGTQYSTSFWEDHKLQRKALCSTGRHLVK